MELMFGNQSRFTGSPTQATCSVIPNRAIGEGGLISYGPLMSASGHSPPVDTSVTTHDEMAVTTRREIAVATLLINQSYTRTAERGVIGKPREGLR